MPRIFFLFCRFHLFRSFRAQPVLFSSLSLSLILFLSAWLVHYEQQTRASAARFEWQAILAAETKAPKLPTILDSNSGDKTALLPPFQNAVLIEALGRVADGASLSFTEVSYELDDQPAQPFRRYRMILTASSSYRSIRHFVDRIRKDLANVSLDAISCSRSSVEVVPVSCELAFSVFFSKEANE